MKHTTPPAETPPVEPIPADIPADVPAKKMSIAKFVLTYVVLPLAIIAVIVPAAMQYQTIIGQAAGKKCRLITKVAIAPGGIVTYTGYPSTNLSALAYDYNGEPIFNAVKYEWGMSSTNSIGTVKAKGDLATFFPLRTGTGDLYVKAKNNCTQNAVIGSIKVVVQKGTIPTPTVKPRK